MEKVKKMVEAGVSITGAIKEALSQGGLETVNAFAEKYDLSRSSVGMHLRGYVRADDSTINALITELGGSADEWRELLWLAGKPEKASV